MAAFGAAALATAVAGRQQGSYGISWWAPECAGLLAVAYLLFAIGRRPPGAVVAAAAALGVLGVWSLASIAWGGNVEDAWLFADRTMLAAAALLVGGLVRPGLKRPVVAGVTAGLLLQAADLVGRVGAGVAPADWFYGRTIDGPLGYHNGEAALFAVGLALLAPGLAAARPARRAYAAAAAVVLLSALLLTQSRGALAAAALGVIGVAALARDARLIARILPLPAIAAALLLTLRHVDRALLGAAGPVHHPFVGYVAISGLLATGYAVAVAVPLRPAWARRLVVLAATATATALVVGGWLHGPLVAAARTAQAQLSTDAAPLTAAGSTRYASLSLNGRRDMWRVAADIWGTHPLVGSGQGAFAREWTVRRHSLLYVLQPHSVELELGAELGLVGVGLFAVFASFAVRALGRLRRPGSCAAAGALVALLVQASVDWTWSFPGLVAPVMLVVGAAAVGRPGRGVVPGRGTVLVAAVAVLALGASVLLPWAADRNYRQAERQAAPSPVAAWAALARAHRLDPWNPNVVMLQGDVARDAGRLREAAARYGAAARLSRRPWVALFQQAKVSRLLGTATATRNACRRAAAENPLEATLRTGACSVAGPDRKEGVRTAKALATATAVQEGLEARWR